MNAISFISRKRILYIFNHEASRDSQAFLTFFSLVVSRKMTSSADLLPLIVEYTVSFSIVALELLTVPMEESRPDL